MEKEDLDIFYDLGTLSQLDIQFARLTARLAGKDVPEVSFAAALVSSYTREGHICLDLSSVEGKPLLEREDGGNPIVCPELN